LGTVILCKHRPEQYVDYTEIITKTVCWRILQ